MASTERLENRTFREVAGTGRYLASLGSSSSFADIGTKWRQVEPVDVHHVHGLINEIFTIMLLCLSYRYGQRLLAEPDDHHGEIWVFRGQPQHSIERDRCICCLFLISSGRIMGVWQVTYHLQFIALSKFLITWVIVPMESVSVVKIGP